jgi:hypothetical protein
MVKLRKSTLALIYGAYKLTDEDNPDVYAYTRSLKGERYLVLLNFHAVNATCKPLLNMAHAKTLINNYGGNADVMRDEVKLKPYQAAILKLE